MANSFLDKTGLTYLWSKIVALVGTKQDALTFDNSPTNNSSNPVKSGGVYSALAGKAASDHTQAVNKGGTNITSYTKGDILYASGASTLSKLAGNTTTTQKFLAMTGTGSAAAAPQWVDVPSGEVFTVTLSVSHQVYTANKTFAEIQAAFNSGKTVVVNVPDTGGSHYVLCYLSSLSSSSASFVGFDTYSYNSSCTAIRRISCAISSSNSVSVSRTHVTTGHAAEAITINIYEGDTYTAYCEDYVNIDDIYNVAYYAYDGGDKGYIRALIIADGTSGTASGAPEPPTDNQWYNLTNAEKYYDYDANEEIWTLYYTFTLSGVFNVNGTSYLRTIKVTDASNSWDNLSGATVTYTESTVGGDYLPLSGGTMTGPITLNNGVAIYTAQEAGWSMNQYGNLTHRRSNASDYFGIIGGSGDFRVYYDSGNVGTNGNIEASGNIVAAGGNLYVDKSDYPYIHFRNASGAEAGGMWCYISGKRMVIRTHPTAGSSYATDVYFPSANASGNETLYVYTTRNISYNSSTKVLAITSPS